MSPCMLSLHLFFGRPLLLLPETASLSDFIQIWLGSRLKLWPNHFSLVFQESFNNMFTCTSFPMYSLLMWSNLVFSLAHLNILISAQFSLLSSFFFYGPKFRTVCHCWSDDCFWRLCLSIPRASSYRTSSQILPSTSSTRFLSYCWHYKWALRNLFVFQHQWRISIISRPRHEQQNMTFFSSSRMQASHRGLLIRTPSIIH